MREQLNRTVKSRRWMYGAGGIVGAIILVSLTVLIVQPALIVSAGFFMIGLWSVQRRRFLENLPRSKIRSAAIGWVELQVCTGAGIYLISPVSRTACAHFCISFSEFGRKPKSIECPFPLLVRDETGVAAIRSAEAFRGISTPAAARMISSPSEIPEDLRRFLDANGVDVAGLRFPFSLTETTIAMEQEVYAIGVVRAKRSAELAQWHQWLREGGFSDPECRESLVEPLLILEPGTPPGFLRVLPWVDSCLWISAGSESRLRLQLWWTSAGAFLAAAVLALITILQLIKHHFEMGGL